MAISLALEAIADLPRTPASDMKKIGWRGVMRSVGRTGKVVVTNHDQPEAVIISAAEYDVILRALQEGASRDQEALDVLRRRFDERLSVLQEAGAGDRLRAVARNPARLGGKAKAGAEH